MQRLAVEPLFYIFFIYGVSFLLLAYLVAKGARGSGSVPMISSFNMLALFGLTHGITELTDWIRFIRKTLDRPESAPLIWLSQVCLVLSFLMLLQFALNLMAAQWVSSAAGAVKLIPALTLAVFIVIVLVRGMTEAPAVGLLGRYAFGFPSAGMAAIALLLTARTLTVLGDEGITKGLYVAAVGFACYAVFGGLIVKPIAGMPIQLFRSACAVTIALSCFSLIRLSSTVASAGPAAKDLQWQQG